MTRRRFIAGAAISPLILSSSLAAPSERVRLGLVGCGGRGRQMIPMFLSSPHAQITAVCDAIEPRMDDAIKLIEKDRPGERIGRHVHYREILDRPDVDAVIIATTQHWHGLPHIHAAEAKKHIFVEKPLSHTVVEGRAMVEAAKKHGVVAMMGTQQRCGDHYQKAVQLIQAGRLGKVALVECWNYHNAGARAGRAPETDPPPGCHWDLWLGPAPKVPFSFSRLNNSWWFDYAGGMLTNWGVHHIDIILWAMDSYDPRSISCAGGKFVTDDLADTPDTIDATWDFGSWMMQYTYRGWSNFHRFPSRPNHHGICFHGQKATLVLDRHGYEIWDEGNPKEVAEKVTAYPYYSATQPTRSEQDGRWQRIFVDAVRGGAKTPVDLEQSHRATVCCHLANISYLVGRRIGWNAKDESIPDDAEADRMLARARRKGFELPSM